MSKVEGNCWENGRRGLIVSWMRAIIRAAENRDRAQWTALRSQLWPECPPDRHKLEVKQLLKSNGLVIVAEVEDKLVGFAEISIRRDHVEGTSEVPVPYLEGWYVS